MNNEIKEFPGMQPDVSKFTTEDFLPATEEEKHQQEIMGESTTFFRDGMRKLSKNPLAMGALAVLLLISQPSSSHPPWCPITIHRS